MKKLLTYLLLSIFFISCVTYSSKAQKTTNKINKTTENSSHNSNAQNTNQPVNSVAQNANQSANSDKSLATETPTPSPPLENKSLIVLQDGQKVTFEVKQDNSWDFLKSATFWVSFLAFLVSLVTAFFLYLGFNLSAYQMRLSARIHFQDLLIDQGKLVMDHPELSGIWDESPIRKNPEDKALQEETRLRAKAYIMLNTFAVVFAVYNDSWNLPGIPSVKEQEKDSLDAWREYLKYFIKNSTIAKDIIKREENKKIFNKTFWEEVGKVQADLDGEKKIAEAELKENEKLKKVIEDLEKKNKKLNEENKSLQNENLELVKKLEDAEIQARISNTKPKESTEEKK